MSNRRNLTKEVFEDRLHEIYGDEYSTVTEYKNMKSKVKIRHNCEKCNHFEWEVYPQNILNGHGCPRCSGRMVMTQDEFINALGEEYFLKSDYHGIQQMVCIRHHKPDIHVKDHNFYISPKQFIQGKGCPECERLKEGEKLAVEISKMTNGEYSMVGEYYNRSEKINIRHNSSKCNFHEWKIIPYNFIAGHRCPKCRKPGRRPAK